MPPKRLKHLKQWSGDVATPEPLFARKATSRWLVLHCPESQRHVTFWVILRTSSLVIFMFHAGCLHGRIKVVFCSKWEFRVEVNVAWRVIYLSETSWQRCKICFFSWTNIRVSKWNSGTSGTSISTQKFHWFAADRFWINFSWWRGWLLSCCRFLSFIYWGGGDRHFG